MTETAKREAHTPGPWTCAFDNPKDKDIGYVRTAGTEGWGHFDKEIAVCYTTNDETKANARLIAATPEMLEALEQLECPLCEHPLGLHADRYGCEHDRGDGYRPGSEVLEALGPCACKGGVLEDIQRVIAAIRKARGVQ